MLTKQEIETKVKTSFPDATVSANDLTGGGDHWQLTITSASFKGLSMIQQHQLVYKALGSWLKNEIHALTLNTKTP